MVSAAMSWTSVCCSLLGKGSAGVGGLPANTYLNIHEHNTKHKRSGPYSNSNTMKSSKQCVTIRLKAVSHFCVKTEGSRNLRFCIPYAVASMLAACCCDLQPSCADGGQCLQRAMDPCMLAPVFDIFARAGSCACYNVWITA